MPPAWSLSNVVSIGDRDPRVVGLQEAALWRSGPHESSPATHVAYDFLATLLGKPADRGLHHRAAAVVTDGGFGPRRRPGRAAAALSAVAAADAASAKAYLGRA